jgi:hypothetical protein
MALLDEELRFTDISGRELVLAANWGYAKDGSQSLALCLFQGAGEDERLLHDWTLEEVADLEGDINRQLFIDDYQGGVAIIDHAGLTAMVAFARQALTLFEAAVDTEPRSRLSPLAG